MKTPGSGFGEHRHIGMRKLDLCLERNPEIDYYNDEYLVLLTADTVRETAFSDYTLAACEALMAARGQ